MKVGRISLVVLITIAMVGALAFYAAATGAMTFTSTLTTTSTTTNTLSQYSTLTTTSTTILTSTYTEIVYLTFTTFTTVVTNNYTTTILVTTTQVVTNTSLVTSTSTITLPNTTSTSTAIVASIVTSSPPTGQWLVINDHNTTLSVTANNTGTITQYASLADLNQTIIGERCFSVINSICVSWQNETQTGWYLDSTNHLLYVHYLGGPAVKLDIAIGPPAVSSSNVMSSFPVYAVAAFAAVASAGLFVIRKRK